jgi:hypothetical protein
MLHIEEPKKKRKRTRRRRRTPQPSLKHRSECFGYIFHNYSNSCMIFVSNYYIVVVNDVREAYNHYPYIVPTTQNVMIIHQFLKQIIG